MEIGVQKPGTFLEKGVPCPLDKPVKGDQVVLQAREEEILEEAESPVTLAMLEEVLEGVQSLSDSDEEWMPMSLKLLEQLSRIIPLLVQLEQGQNRLKREELELLNRTLNDEVFKNNIIGCINLFGGGISAAGGALGGDAVARVLSSVVQGVSTFQESGKIRSQKEFQVEEFSYQEIKELKQWLQQMQQKMEEAVNRIQQLSFLRV